LPLDVNDDDSVVRYMSEAERRVGPCDILINNAGGAKGTGRVVDADISDWSWMIDTNATSLFRLTQKIVGQMQQRGGGDIVMVASVAGIEPYPGGSVYCAVKAAVQAFARALRQEVLGQNIRVMTLDPGLVETEFSLVRLGDAEKAAKVYEGLTPLQADDVADCAVFAVTRPRHVCLDHLLVLATAQAGTRAIHRDS
jgi:NADP-dependent 3-hydroxy acid dehydrogenase YdfG